jgi:hypothetical protein
MGLIRLRICATMSGASGTDPFETGARHKRPLVESVFSWLKSQYGLTVNNVRRLGCVSVYALLSLLCVVLVREAAECLGRPDKAVSPTFFNV